MAIQTDFPDHFELWYPLWTNTQDVGWKVRYRGLRFERSSALPPRRLQEVKTELKEAISQTEAFARRPEVGQIDWADWFSKALQQIDSQSPQGAFYPNVLPDVGYSLASRQILAACQQADVFGGMGSWNDIGFEDKRLQNEYNQLSAQLYSAIKIGYVTVANLFGLNAD